MMPKIYPIYEYCEVPFEFKVTEKNQTATSTGNNPNMAAGTRRHFHPRNPPVAHKHRRTNYVCTSSHQTGLTNPLMRIYSSLKSSLVAIAKVKGWIGWESTSCACLPTATQTLVWRLCRGSPCPKSTMHICPTTIWYIIASSELARTCLLMLQIWPQVERRKDRPASGGSAYIWGIRMARGCWLYRPSSKHTTVIGFQWRGQIAAVKLPTTMPPNSPQIRPTWNLRERP